MDSVICVRNCEPNVDVSQPTELKVVCHKDCESPAVTDWKVDIPDYNKTGDSYISTDPYVFILKPNKLEFRKNYTVTFMIVGKPDIKATFDLITHSFTSLRSCEMNPKEGYAVKTQFLVQCLSNPSNVSGRYFEIYATQNDKDYLLAAGPNPEYLPFILKANDKVKVKLMDKFHIHYSKLLDVTVKSVFENVTTKEDLKREIQRLFFDKNSNQSIDNLLKSKNYDQLMQSFRVLSGDLAKLSENGEFKDIIKGYNMGMLERISEVTIIS
ncbi:hypothetical protein JTB14_005109 [Gonioctena quinquepunctata]|nr:hypothetical protein JTB14_005109 [Gonioctena quinquepunctata]